LISTIEIADLAPRHVLQLLRHALHLGALGADHQARTGGAEDDLELFAGALNVDISDRRVGGLTIQARIEETPDLLVFNEEFAVERLGGVPAAAVRFGDAEPKAERMGLLSH
jgi:hypothetical protein